MFKRLTIVLKILGVAIAAAVICGIVYEQIGRARDRKRLPQIGTSYDIGGRTLNLFCSGTGSPAVILESASGMGVEFQQVQTEIGKLTQTCWYDRAGMGWSDPGPFPRTASALADDLHALLKRAGVSPPYVLAGFSFAGLPMRVFAGRYTSEMAGMVLIDTAHEDEPLRAPRFYLARTAPPYLWHPLCFAYQTAAFVGLLRLTESPTRRDDPPADATAEEKRLAALLATLRHEPAAVVTSASAGIVSPESYAEAAAASGLGDRPVLVVTAGKAFDFGDTELNRQAAAYQQIWVHEIQTKLLRLSSDSRQIILSDSTHGSIPVSAQVSAIQSILQHIREKQSSH
jgi:hypothetical protein